MSAATAPPSVAPDVEAPLDRARRILSGDIRPDDYLPVTSEVRRLADRVVEAGRERVRSVGIPDVDPAWSREVLFDHILLVHCKHQHVAYLRDDHGIIVVMFGLDEYARMFRELPPELTSDRVWTGYPTDDVFFL